jgi:hypothetical protein
MVKTGITVQGRRTPPTDCQPYDKAEHTGREIDTMPKPLITHTEKKFQVTEINGIMCPATYHKTASFDKQEDAVEYAKFLREHRRDFVRIQVNDRDTKALVFSC